MLFTLNFLYISQCNDKKSKLDTDIFSLICAIDIVVIMALGLRGLCSLLKGSSGFTDLISSLCIMNLPSFPVGILQIGSLHMDLSLLYPFKILWIDPYAIFFP